MDQSAAKTTISFTLTGQSGTTDFGNLTIPKTSVPNGAIPQIFIDNQLCPDQGYTEDANNYYVWYVTHFSTHAVSIVFTGTAHATQEVPTVAIAAAAVIILVVAVAVVLLLKKRGKA